MKRLTAKDALQRSKENKPKIIEQKFNAIMMLIESAIEDGETHINISGGVSMEVESQLKYLGYDVGEYHLTLNNQKISWNN